VLFDKDKGIFQNAVKNKTEEKEILGVIIKEIKELSSKNSKESKDIAKLIDGINLDEIQTITEFAEKVLRGGNDSFQNRGTILKYLLQDKQTKITKSTREAHQVLHYKYGIPTLQDIALGMNEEHFSNAELGDVVKYVRPDVKNLVIYTTDNNLFDELSKKPTKEMVKNNIKIELLPSELGHISYPFVIKGENLGIGDNYLNAVDMYNEQKKAGLKKSQSFFTLGRQKADASTGVIPESPESQGTPINLPESSTNKIQARISVFHGSPHAFDKFSTKKIGSGEGAQAFGWGLYFTELKDIAQSYANKLSDYFPDNSIADNPLANKFIGEDGQWKEYQEMGYTLIDAAKELNKIYQDSIKDSKNGIKNIDIGIENAKYAFQEQQASKKKKLDYIIEKENLDPNDQYQKQKIEEYKDALNYYDNEPNWEGMKQERLAYYEKEIKRDTADADATKFVIDNIDKYKKRRTLYEVILHEGKTPEQYQYMRWDEVVPGSIIKKLQSQSEKEGRDWSMYNHEEIKVIEAPEWTNKKGYVVSNGSDGFIGNVYETKDEANKYRDGIINNYKINGNELYRNLISEIGSPEKASKFLLDAGIDGIKYPAESAGRNNENVRGFNYVVFDDSEISVGNKVQYRKSSIKWEKSKEGKGDPSISSRNAVVMQAANDLKNGKISNEEYRAVVSENSPIRPITRFFEPANENDIFNALSVDKRAQINQPIDNGQIVGLRLDIPAYKNNNTWVVSVHDGNTNAGKVLSYDNAARITNVTFGVEPKGALAIATGKPKATIGRMFGEWQNIEGATLEEKGEAAKKIVEDIANSEEWVQVGMNPFRHSYFYDRSSDLGRPINSAEEVVQVGGLVYAKNPEYGNWTDEAYRVKGLFDKNKAPVQFRRGIVPTGGVPSVPGETGIEKTGETGLPQKKVYSWEKGEEGKPQPGETMIPTSTGRYVAIETMKGQQMDREKKLSEIEKAKPSFFKSAYSWLKVALIDNQAAVLTALANIGKQGQLVKAYLLTRNSASATASILSDKAINEVYGDISKKKMFDINGAKVSEYQLLNQMIGYQRVISIQQQMNDVYKSMIQALRDGNMAQYNIDKQRLVDNNMMDKNGDYVGENLDVEFAMGQVTSTQAKALLYETREAIGEAAFDKLMNSSKKYSDFLNSMLKSRMEAGLISEESYKYMSKFFYAPTKYISEILTDPILSLTKTSTSFRNESILRVKNLAGGSEKLNMSDYEGLLKAVTYASEYSIAENRATTRFYDLVSGNPTKFEEAGIRIGTKLVPITEEIGNKPGQVEDVIDRNTRMIVEGKKSSALELPSGQKALPFKGMQKVGEMGVQLYQAPVDIITDSNGNKFRIVQELLREGEDYIKTYFGGQRYDIIVPAWFAEQWYNKNTITNSTITSATSFLSKVTGANFLRVVATGINPVFGVAQLIPDTISAYAATLEERKLPLLIDYPIFFAKTLLAARDIKSNSKDFQEAMKYGATTNFYNGGMVSFEQGLLGKEDKSLEKVIESWNVPGLKQYIIGSKKITETTEQMSKVALYKSIRDSKLAQFAKDNGREPNAQEIEDIRIEAGAMARATADFHRKGVLGGELNKIIPYLNAGFQVQKAVISSAKANPKKALYYAMEFAAYGTMLTLSALGMGDDDELKEKKRKAYLKLSEFDRDNRAILYYIESKDRFVSVKLPDFLVPMQSLQRRLTERTYLENKSLNNKDVLSIASNVTDAIPVTQFANLEKVASRNPAYSFISKLKYNRDPYRQEEVVPYEKATKDYLEGAEAGKRRAGKIYQTIGKAAISPLLPEGISPKRMEAAVGSIPFQSNPFSGAILMGLEWSASEKDLFDERYGKTTRDVIMKASGITDRYMKEGSKINQNIIDLPMEEVKGRGEFKNTIAEMLIPKFDSAVVNLTRPEAFKKVRTEFINNEYKKLTPEQKEISRAFIEGELKSMAKTKTKDEFVLQIAKMAGSDAKIDGILETISTIKVSSASKVQFIRDLVDAGLVSSPGTQKSMNVRGRKTLTTGEKNPYYEPEVGYIRDEILKYVEEKKKPQ
jgi:hypothetical protein